METLKELTLDDWKYLGSAIGLFLLAFWSNIRGKNKTAVEVGAKPPPVDLLVYVQKDVRSMSRQIETLAGRIESITSHILSLHRENRETQDEILKALAQIHLDTQILRERRDPNRARH